MWQCKPFDLLSIQELFAIYKIRTAVFVVEQHCPYQEVDDKDLSAHHLFYTENGEIRAYCRILIDKSAVHFGRVLVAQSARSTGLGRELVAKAIEIIQQNWAELPIEIQAQSYLKKFYDSFGFKPISEDYLEDGIPHVDMRLSV